MGVLHTYRARLSGTPVGSGERDLRSIHHRGDKGYYGLLCWDVLQSATVSLSTSPASRFFLILYVPHRNLDYKFGRAFRVWSFTLVQWCSSSA